MAISRGQKAGSGFGGALGGAATGAGIGSFFPGIGTAVGAGVGGLAGLVSGLLGAGKTNNQIAKESSMQQRGGNANNGMLQSSNNVPGSLWGGRDASVDRYSYHTPEQTQFQNNILNMLNTHLVDSANGKSPMDELALRQWREEILPEVSANFEGGNYDQQSTAMAERLALGLAGKRQDFLQGLINPALSRSFGAVYNEEQPGLGEKIFSDEKNLNRLFSGATDLAGKAKGWYDQRQTNKQGNNTVGKVSAGANDFQIPVRQPSAFGGGRVGWNDMLVNSLKSR